jgi:hypothetical protein
MLVTVSVYDGGGFCQWSGKPGAGNVTGQIRDMRTRILRVGQDADFGWPVRRFFVNQAVSSR